MNLVSLLLRQAEENPEAVALIERDRYVSFAELEGLAAHDRRRAWPRLGVEPGDRVAIACHNDVAFVSAYLGALWAGAVAVPLNPLAPASVLAGQAERVQARVLLCGPGTEDLLELPGAVRGEPDPGEAEPMRRRGRARRRRSSRCSSSHRAPPARHGRRCSATGTSPRTSVRCRVIRGSRSGPTTSGLAALPFFHVFGLNVGLGVGLQAGLDDRCCSTTSTPARAAELIRVHSVTIVAGVPTMFGAFLDLPDELASPVTFATVRLAVSGAAELSVERAEAFRTRFGITIYEGYGLTEAAPIVSTTAVKESPHWGSIGPPLPGIDVRLVGDDGEDVLAGDPGEIWVKGPNVFSGYWSDPDATERVLVDGWLHTGDVAIADDDGYLSLVDRKKDLVIVSGFNVFPAEVEEVLLAHPDIADAAVIGIPNPRTGEAVAAWVVLEPGANLTIEQVREHTARHLARYKVPAVVEIVDALPRNEAGKLLRRELRVAG